MSEASDRIRELLALPQKPVEQTRKNPPPVAVGYNAASGQLQYQGGNGAISEGRLKTSGAAGLGDPVLGMGGVAIAKPHVKRVSSDRRVYPAIPQRIKVLFAVPKIDPDFVDLYIGGHSAPILIEENYELSLTSECKLSNVGLEAEDYILTTLIRTNDGGAKTRFRSKEIDRIISSLSDFNGFEFERGLVDQGYGNCYFNEDNRPGVFPTPAGSYSVASGSYSHLSETAITNYAGGTLSIQNFNEADIGDRVFDLQYSDGHQYLNSSESNLSYRTKTGNFTSSAYQDIGSFVRFGQSNQGVFLNTIYNQTSSVETSSQIDNFFFVENGEKTSVFQFNQNPFEDPSELPDFPLYQLLLGNFNFYNELEIPDHSIWGKRATSLLENQKAYAFVNTEPYSYTFDSSNEVESYALSDIFANGGDVKWLLVGVSPTNFEGRIEFETPIYPLGIWPPLTRILSISLFNEDVTA